MLPAPAPLRNRRSFWAVALALVTAGCGGDPAFPSLAPRPIEDMSLAEPTLPPAPAGTAGDEATAEYQPLVAKAQEADRQFHEALAAQRSAIVAGHSAAIGSDAWIAAQQALTRVVVTRTPVAAALADLQAARDGVAARTDTGKAAAIANAYNEVEKIDAAETGAIAAIAPAN